MLRESVCSRFEENGEVFIPSKPVVAQILGSLEGGLTMPGDRPVVGGERRKPVGTDDPMGPCFAMFERLEGLKELGSGALSADLTLSVLEYNRIGSFVGDP